MFMISASGGHGQAAQQGTREDTPSFEGRPIRIDVLRSQNRYQKTQILIFVFAVFSQYRMLSPYGALSLYVPATIYKFLRWIRIRGSQKIATGQDRQPLLPQPMQLDAGLEQQVQQVIQVAGEEQDTDVVEAQAKVGDRVPLDVVFLKIVFREPGDEGCTARKAQSH